MRTQNTPMRLAKACMIALAISIVPATGGAQAPDTSHAKKPHPGATKDRQATARVPEGTTGRHHVLAMAYRDNLAVFARVLRGQVRRAKIVELEMARPAVAEMRRSYDEMRRHHRAEMPGMGDHEMARVSRPMQQMETRLSALGEQLAALELEVGGGTPDPRKVSDLATRILKHAAGMPAMHAAARSEKPVR